MTTELWIAPGGDDANPGTKDQPLATLERARAVLRALPHPKGATVWLRGGVYSRTQTFFLQEQDSGAAGAPIVYRACPGEEPRLVGGVEVTGFEPVTDPITLARLPETVRGKVLETDLRAQGLTDLGELRPRGFGRPTVPAALELFFSGKPMVLARWPGGKYTWTTGLPSDSDIRTIGKGEEGFHYRDDILREWPDTEDLWVYGYWVYDWAEGHEKVTSVDPESGWIRTAPPYPIYGYRTAQRFEFYNLLEHLARPGEYYVDRKTGRLYFYPPEEITEGSAWVSLLEQPLVAMENVAHVALEGLTLEVARGNGVEVTGGESVVLAGCTLRNLGNWGVKVEGGRRHCVLSCNLHDLGEGGISLSGGDLQTLTPAEHQADNNRLHHLGRWVKCYTAAVHLQGVGQRVTHNLIHDLPHIAILLNGAEHLIELNETHDVCLETGDAGSFYLGRNWAERGNVVRHNFFHHTAGLGLGTNVVYLDDYAAGVVVHGNIIYRGQRGVFINGGRDHRITNNLFIRCSEGAVRVNTNPMPADHPTYERMRKEMEQVGAFGPPYTERYPELLEIIEHYDKNETIPTEGNLVARNVVVEGNLLLEHGSGGEAARELRDNVVGADPAEVFDGCRLREDSPAWPPGWEPIPFEEMGLYADEYRAAETIPERSCWT